jgi:nucleotide-binding universal stress UspA family protein
MASKTYLVPVDFSKGSEAALDSAIRIAKEHGGKLLLLHVISTAYTFPLETGFPDIFETLEKNARESMAKLIRRKRLKPRQCRSMLIAGVNPADVIAAVAKKSRAAMMSWEATAKPASSVSCWAAWPSARFGTLIARF